MDVLVTLGSMTSHAFNTSMANPTIPTNHSAFGTTASRGYTRCLYDPTGMPGSESCTPPRLFTRRLSINLRLYLFHAISFVSCSRFAVIISSIGQNKQSGSSGVLSRAGNKDVEATILPCTAARHKLEKSSSADQSAATVNRDQMPRFEGSRVLLGMQAS